MKPTVGRIVHFLAPTACVGPGSKPDAYAAVVTQVNKDETVELATFGPNSLYFQHNVPFSEEAKPGTCFWPPRV